MASKKLPIKLKQAEVSIQRFEDIVNREFVDTLKKHRHHSNNNAMGGGADWQKMERLMKQMTNHLLEMDTLRESVCEEDRDKFDIRIRASKRKVEDGMKEYAELKRKSQSSRLSNNDEDIEEFLESGQVQLRTNFQLEEHKLALQKAQLNEVEHLQNDIRDLNGMFHGMREMVQDQETSVQIIADNAEEALENVQAGERQLRRALIYKKAMYPVVGALLGTCLGGPIGLVAGLKAGGLAAVGCGILGYTSGTVLKDSSSDAIMHGNIEEQQIESENTSETIQLTEKPA